MMTMMVTTIRGGFVLQLARARHCSGHTMCSTILSPSELREKVGVMMRVGTVSAG